MMLELIARIDEIVFRYDNRTHTHVPATDFSRSQHPEQDQLMLATDAGRWCGEPSGPINFIELKAPGSIGLVVGLRAADGSSRSVSWTFELSAQAREAMAQASENWTDHIHVRCVGH